MRTAKLKAGLLTSATTAALIISLPGLAHAAEAAAADDATEIEQITVTARRREEKLQEVPITVSAVSGKALATERLDRVADYASKIAGFAALQQNTRVSTLTIRGVGGNANSDGSEAGVGLIVDDVVFTHPGFSWLDFVDLDHIEVARGPQGTLLGKNTTIGALIVTTKAPSFTPEAAVSVTLGNHDRRQVRVNVSGPLVGDTLAGRLTFYKDVGDGWITNKYDGQDYLDVNRWAIRGQLLFQSGAFSNRLTAEHYSTREYNNFYPPVGDPLTYVNGAARNGWARKLTTNLGFTPSYDVENNANVDTQNRIVSRTDGLSNKAELQIGGHTLTSVTAWRKLYFRPDNDSDGTPLPIFGAGYDVDVDQYSQEIRLASPTGGAFDYQVGVYALRQDVLSNYRVRFLSKASAYFLSPALPAAILNGVESDQIGRAKTWSYAGFGQGTWHVNDKAQVTAGLRYTWEDKRASNQALSFGGAALPAALAPYRAAVTGAAYTVSAEKKKGEVSWLINPSYKLTDDILAYASVSRGVKSGAANLGAKVGDQVIIGPETSTDYELGLKTTWPEARAILNANLYWNDIDGYQATLIDPTGSTSRSYLANVGKVRMKGLEVEGQWQATQDLGLSFSAAWNDARYVSYRNAPPPAELTYPGAPTSVNLSDTRVPNAPKFTGRVGADWSHPVGDYVVFAYGNQTWRSDTYTHVLSAYGRQKAYGLTNLGIGLRTADDKYAVQLWAKNLFDKRYAAAFGSASASTPYIEILGDPRTFGVTLTAKAF